MTDHTPAVWRKSTHSGNGGNCVEVAFLDSGMVGVRDSKDSRGPILQFSPAAWANFVYDVSSGDFRHS